MHNSISIAIFKKSLLEFVRPSPNNLFNRHSPEGIKYEVRSRLGLSHLRAFKIPWIYFVTVVVKQEQLLIFLVTSPSFVLKENRYQQN